MHIHLYRYEATHSQSCATCVCANLFLGRTSFSGGSLIQRSSFSACNCPSCCDAIEQSSSLCHRSEGFFARERQSGVAMVARRRCAGAGAKSTRRGGGTGTKPARRRSARLVKAASAAPSEDEGATTDDGDYVEAEHADVVDVALLGKLRDEVRRGIECICVDLEAKKYRCAACPFRTFQRPSRVKKHVTTYHTEKQRYAPAGALQLVVVNALHDHDMLFTGTPAGEYLARCAVCLRQHAITDLPDRNRIEPGTLKKVFTAGGPVFHISTDLNVQVMVRKISTQTYADHGFYMLVFSEAVLSKAKIKGVVARVQARHAQQGSALVSLLPTESGWWQTVLEDIMASKSIAEIKQGLRLQCLQHNRYKYCSADATVKCCMSLRGQANYRASAALRADQAIAEGDKLYRVLTLRGRTGTCRLAEPVVSEAAVHVVPLLCKHMSKEELGQMELLAGDAPSLELEDRLRPHCPKLKGLCLEQTHVSMKYESVQWGRKTKVSKCLRHIMRKCLAFSPTTPVEHWGAMFTSSTVVSTSAKEEKLRKQVFEGSMRTVTARKVLETTDADVPFFDRCEFVKAIAAVVALFPKNVQKKDTAGKTLRHALWNATDPKKVEYLFNGIRYRHMITPEERVLLAGGTCSNEAMHGEMKPWFREEKNMYQSSLRLKLDVFVFNKHVSHNVALYRPTSRALQQNTIFHRVIGALPLWSTEAWSDWCREKVDAGGETACVGDDLPLRKLRKRHEDAVRSHTPAASLVEKKTRISLKARKKAVKRTAFTVKRSPEKLVKRGRR